MPDEGNLLARNTEGYNTTDHGAGKCGHRPDAVRAADSRAHGTDESLHLGDFAAACVAETLMLNAFAQLDLEG